MKRHRQKKALRALRILELKGYRFRPWSDPDGQFYKVPDDITGQLPDQDHYLLNMVIREQEFIKKYLHEHNMRYVWGYAWEFKNWLEGELRERRVRVG